jgi:hypothetical protein
MGTAGPRLSRDIELVLDGDMETSGQCDLIFLGDEVPEDDESHIEDFKRERMKVIKHATHHNKKDVAGIRMLVEKNSAMGHKRALVLPIPGLKIMSDGIQAFLGKADK